MRKIILLPLLLLSFSLMSQPIHIIPAPVLLTQGGSSFVLRAHHPIWYEYEDMLPAATYLRDQLQLMTGIRLPLRKGLRSKGISLRFAVLDNSSEGAYTIHATKDTVLIAANKAAGVFYGIQSLLQMLVKDAGKWNIPAADIYDYPRFSYRGLHLDVGRHFFPVAFIKRYIDLMALYKFNTFHWHLTEDQGWRIEIKAYPDLTAIGSKREETILGKNFDPYKGDGIPYEGFYTQEQIKELVRYAADRQITIIPEIEMPGHSLAALAAYRRLGCTGGPYKVGTRWGVEDDVYCAGKEETFKFLEDVLDEVMALFPGKYIHIGGDECPKKRWKTCRKCQQRIQDNNLKDEHELQSYFIRRIEKYLNSKGRQIIGWDEILEGGLAPNATVMSWRGEEGGIAAAKQHHDAIMTPGGYCYLDHYQAQGKTEPLAIGGFTSVEKIYGYDPVPASLTAAEAAYIKGAQGNVWTEYMTTTSQVEYMVYPRAIALAEVLWSPKTKRNYENFLQRLSQETKRLDRWKVNYAKHVFGLNVKVSPVADGGIAVTMNTRNKKGRILYTTDGTEPTSSSPEYAIPLTINKNSSFRAGVFEAGQLVSNLYEQDFLLHKAVGKKISLANPPNPNYNPGSTFFLVNGIEGVVNYSDNQWHGFSGNHLDALIDLGAATEISELGINILNNKKAWIHPPESVVFYTGSATDDLKEVGTLTSFDTPGINKVRLKLSAIARYIRVVAKNIGKIPEGYEGTGYNAWLFADEIIVF
jgi:hexosaminidase